MSKNHASKEWLYERIAGAISIPLLIWLIVSLIKINCGKCHATIDSFLSQSHNAILLVLFLGNFLVYSTLAMKVVFEDYIHNLKLRDALIKLMYVAGVVAFALAAYSILTIHNL